MKRAADLPRMVIVNDEGEFWNNEAGWSDLAEATRFSNREFKRLRLPMGGRWSLAPDLVR